MLRLIKKHGQNTSLVIHIFEGVQGRYRIINRNYVSDKRKVIWILTWKLFMTFHLSRI